MKPQTAQVMLLSQIFGVTKALQSTDTEKKQAGKIVNCQCLSFVLVAHSVTGVYFELDFLANRTKDQKRKYYARNDQEGD